jgi:cytochrome c biogenesis protein CcmG/thiol:disulfide interchange protein DsbE
MKRCLRAVLFLLSLLIIVVGSGCGSNSGNADTNAASPAPANVAGSGKSRSAEFPPLASGLAQAEFELLDGTKFKVTDKKGKVLLLNLWGTWCGPCREEMPHLVEMQNKYADQGLEIIGLNIGDGSGSPEPTEQINSFVEKMKLNYTIARSQNSSTVEFYRITKQQVVPQTLLVDKEGHLRGMFIGGGARVINLMKETLDKTMSEYTP